MSLEQKNLGPFGITESGEKFNPSQIVIATTAFYPKYDGENSADWIRGNLLIELAQNTKKHNFQLAIVDGGSSPTFISKLFETGATVHPQTMSGMDGSRFQVYQEAHKLNGSKVAVWTEEKPSLISDELEEAVKLILNGEAKIVVPARIEEGFLSYSDYQMISEKSANSIITTTLIRHKKENPQIFPNLDSIPYIDWFLGPKIWSMELFNEFTNNTDFWKNFIDRLRNHNPRLMKSYGYCGSLILPVIYELHKGNNVISFEMKNYRYPKVQRDIEIAQKGTFLKKRGQQLSDINIIVDQFCQYLLTR
jgi:hypothetical protein